MTEQHDPARRLDDIGRRPMPPLTDERVEALEARVMASIAVAPTPAERSIRWAPFVLTAAAAIVVVLVISLAFAAGEQTQFEIAEGVVLELPDGTAVASRGDELTDGVIVAISAGGFAMIDGERFGPGRYVVADGRLAPLDTTSGTPGGSTSPPPTSSTGAVTTSGSPATSTSVLPTVSRDDRDVVVDSTRPKRRTTTTTEPERDRPITTDRTTTTIRRRDRGGVEPTVVATTVADRPDRTDRTTTTTSASSTTTTTTPTRTPTTTTSTTTTTTLVRDR